MEWQQGVFGSAQKNTFRLKKRLNWVQDQEDGRSGEEALMLQKEINSLLDQDDLKWKQWAKTDWLKWGDHNTKFYHACANQRRKTNQILMIKIVDGSVLESLEEVRIGFIDYFTELFSAGPWVEREACMQFLHRRVSQLMNIELLKVFTRGEVDVALKQMGPLKAPEPDSITTGFF